MREMLVHENRALKQLQKLLSKRKFDNVLSHSSKLISERQEFSLKDSNYVVVLNIAKSKYIRCVSVCMLLGN